MIRPIRWKNKFSTGQPEVDQRVKALVDIFNGSLSESSQVEHCQDLTEVHQCLLNHIETVLAHLDDPDIQSNEQAVREILSTEFPLPARDKPACRHCDQCDQLEQRLKQWLTP